LGNYNNIHANVANLLLIKNIKEDDNAELLVIYKESYLFIDYYWRNVLTTNTKWLIIVPQTKLDSERIYREIKSFGDHLYIEFPEPIIIIKNIKPTFKDEFRNQILQKDTKINLDSFLELNLLEDTITCEKIIDEQDIAIIKSLASHNEYIYVGDYVSDNTLLKNQMFAKMKFHVIENIDLSTGKTIGFFCRNDYISRILIYSLKKSEKLAQFLKFNEIKLTINVV
jgi:hypothetical protein